MSKHKCYNCGTQSYELEYFQVNAKRWLCEACYEDQQRYMDENADAIFDQEQFDQFEQEQ